MRTSNRMLNFIKDREGLVLTASPCPAGICTVGYGHTREVVPGMQINKEQAWKLLIADVLMTEAAINRLVKIELNQNQFDALVSLVFNVRLEEFERSHLLAELNKGNFSEALKYWRSWHHVTIGGKKVDLPGLVYRRNAEIEWFNWPVVETQKSGALPDLIDLGQGRDLKFWIPLTPIIKWLISLFK